MKNPMTVGQLKELLEDLDDDVMIVIGHDNEYTYGTLSRNASLREEVEGEYGTEYEEIDEVCTW